MGATLLSSASWWAGFVVAQAPIRASDAGVTTGSVGPDSGDLADVTLCHAEACGEVVDAHAGVLQRRVGAQDCEGAVAGGDWAGPATAPRGGLLVGVGASEVAATDVLGVPVGQTCGVSVRRSVPPRALGGAQGVRPWLRCGAQRGEFGRPSR